MQFAYKAAASAAAAAVPVTQPLQCWAAHVTLTYAAPMQRPIAILQLLGDVQLANHAAWTTACDLQALKRAVEAIIRDYAHEK
jgi:hypothetical protein